MQKNNEQEMTPHERLRFADSVKSAMKKGQTYVKWHTVHWEKGIGWYGQTKHIEFASDENFLANLKKDEVEFISSLKKSDDE